MKEEPSVAETLHPTEVAGQEGRLRDLAREIENLRYDQTLAFLSELREAFYERHDKDLAAGKTLLSNHLLEVGRSLDDATLHLHLAWKICVEKMDIAEEAHEVEGRAEAKKESKKKATEETAPGNTG